MKPDKSGNYMVNCRRGMGNRGVGEGCLHTRVKEFACPADRKRAVLSISEKNILHQLERISDKDTVARRDAIISLTGIKDARAIYPLIKALQDEDQGVQQAAMDALIAFGDESAVHNLFPLLSDSRAHVRNMAREILEKIGSCGIELFSTYIKDKDDDIRKMIADILGNIDRPEARNLLIEMLKDPNSNVRCAAAEGLGKIGDSSAVEPLINLLDDEEWVAFFITGALGRIGDKRALKYLTQLLYSPNVDLQIMAIDAISRIGGEDAVNSLLEVLDSVKPEAVNIIVKGLIRVTQGNIGKVIDRPGRDRFLEYLNEGINKDVIEEPEVRQDFIKAFSNINNPKSSASILKLLSEAEVEDRDILQSATNALLKLRHEDTLIGALLEGSKCESSTCLLIAIRVLGLLKSTKAVPRLISLFDNVDRDIKTEILHALGKIGGRDSLRFLMDMLSHGEGHIRGAAAQGLGIMAVPEAIESLLSSLQYEEYYNVAEEIVGALVEIGRSHNIPSLFEALLSYLPDKRPYVREMIIKGLGILKYEKVSDYIKGMLCDESWRVRRACLETLSHLNVPGVLDLLITAASDEKDEIRMYVAQLTERYPGEKSVDILISLLSDRNNRIIHKAIEGLLELNVAKAIPYLIELARYHKDTGIRDAAVEAYKKLNVVNDAII